MHSQHKGVSTTDSVLGGSVSAPDKSVRQGFGLQNWATLTSAFSLMDLVKKE
jgi:hypothetical protein